VEFAEQPGMTDVLFDAGHVAIGRHGIEIMLRNAQWLAEHPDYLVLIEGHSDYRGTPEANKALGQQRAKAAMDFFVRVGIAQSRIQTVTYGSDRPVCFEKTDACAAKNRRVHFLVKPR
jgi:peptidoglycan-associated lipoprotein